MKVRGNLNARLGSDVIVRFILPFVSGLLLVVSVHGTGVEDSGPAKEGPFPQAGTGETATIVPEPAAALLGALGLLMLLHRRRLR